MVRESNDKITELLLSLPARRSAFFFGKIRRVRVGGADRGAPVRATVAFLAKPRTRPLGRVLVCELLIVTAMSCSAC